MDSARARLWLARYQLPPVWSSSSLAPSSPPGRRVTSPAAWTHPGAAVRCRPPRPGDTACVSVSTAAGRVPVTRIALRSSRSIVDSDHPSAETALLALGLAAVCIPCILCILDMTSGLLISHADPRPMYLQIMEQIRHRIAIGDWRPGYELPSIRALAAALQISVITVKRAYLELERDGVIVTRQGKGSFVADSAGLSARLHHESSRRTCRRRRRSDACSG